MHLPDGFLSTPLAAVGWCFALPALTWALATTSGEEEGGESTLAALLAACLFAVQTFQFPIPGGTSGHLVGATLVSILCGPATGLLVLTCVVVLQAVLFGDGGLLTLGWNLTNMGLVAGVLGGSLFQGFRKLKLGLTTAAFLSAWIALQLSATCTAFELAAAHLAPLKVSLTAMLSVQAFMGLGEGLVTAAAVKFLAQSRPRMVLERCWSPWPGVVVAVTMVSSVGLAFLSGAIPW